MRVVPEVEARLVRQDEVTNVLPDTGSTRIQDTFRSDTSTNWPSSSDNYGEATTTASVDNIPYTQSSVSQPTRGGENTGEESQSGRRVERMQWDENLGIFTRSIAPPPLSQRLDDQQLPVAPVTFVAVEPAEYNLTCPPLDYVPFVLRAPALAVVVLCCLLMITGILFCNIWSQRHQGLWEYERQGDARYFVFEYFPQLLATIITIWNFVIQSAVYRTIPFATMASKDRPPVAALHDLSLLPRNFIIPDISHFRHGELLAGVSLFIIWFTNFFTTPFICCLFQVKYFIVNGQGTWRWTSVLPIGWLLVALYGLLTVGLLLLLIRFVGTWTGIMWDPISLADLIPIVQRSNILSDFAQSDTALDLWKWINPRTVRLGYWQLSSQTGTFYGIGEAGAPVRSPIFHSRARGRHLDLEQQDTFADDAPNRDLYCPSIRYRWMVWFLRNPSVVAWILIVFALFIAFILVSFIDSGIRRGFPPRLSTLPSASGFSPSNFVYSLIPALIGNTLFLAWQPIDVYFRALQPFADLSSSPHGATAQKSLLLPYPSRLPIEITIQALLKGHLRVAWISLTALVSAGIPILSGGIFMTQWSPSKKSYLVSTDMPAFYALVSFCAFYTLSFLAIFPRRRSRYLPHDISSLVHLISFLYESPLLSDRILREPRSKDDLVTRLVTAPPGEESERPTFGFGVIVGRDGNRCLGVDRFRRPGREDVFTEFG